MGKVVHFEIPVDDVKRAQGFYSDVFGWGINSMPDMGYTLVMTGPTDPKSGPTTSGFINGGMMKRGGQITHPVITVEVENIDEALKKIASRGGAVVMPKQSVGDMGFSAYFKDSEGNVMGLWENAKRAV